MPNGAIWTNCWYCRTTTICHPCGDPTEFWCDPCFDWWNVRVHWWQLWDVVVAGSDPLGPGMLLPVRAVLAQEALGMLVSSFVPCAAPARTVHRVKCSIGNRLTQVI